MADAFEGQVIAASMIISGLILLFLKDYILMNARDAELAELVEEENEPQVEPPRALDGRINRVDPLPDVQNLGNQDRINQGNPLQRFQNRMNQGRVNQNDPLQALLNRMDQGQRDQDFQDRVNEEFQNQANREHDLLAQEEPRRYNLRPRRVMEAEQEPALPPQEWLDNLNNNRLNVNRDALEGLGDNLNRDIQRNFDIGRDNQGLPNRGRMDQGIPNNERDDQPNPDRNLLIQRELNQDGPMNLGVFGEDIPPELAQQLLQRQRELLQFGRIPPREAPENPPQANLNIGINLQVDDGVVAAEINANGDLNAIMEVIGVTGTITKLVRTVLLVHVMAAMILALTVLIPNLTGRAVLYLFKDVYAPLIEYVISSTTLLLQSVTDPILEPMVDASIFLVKQAAHVLGISMNTTSIFGVSVNLTALLNEASQLSAAPTQLNSTLYDFGMLASLEQVNEHIIWTFIGYFSIFLMILVYLAQTGYLENAFAQSTLGVLTSIWTNLLACFKFTFFILIELGAFPTYCGLLIDMCSIPVFGDSLPVQARIKLYEQHPWSFFILHCTFS